ncbi:MAG: M23 family metallopeptidase [Flavobacterium sp.]|jgi:murein DD-endopeptidase MepM/ murein hydrolase activator NlpD
MSKTVKYYYDSETLSYRKIKIRKTTKWVYALVFLLSTAFFGFLSAIALLNSSFLESPKNKIIQRELSNYKLNYSIISNKLSKLEDVLRDLQERDENIYRAYFNATPISDEKKQEQFEKLNRYKELEGYHNNKLIATTLDKINLIEKKIFLQSKSLDKILGLAKGKELFLTAIPAIQPVKNENLTRMASGFGYRNDPFTKARKMHNGMDFTSPTGTPVYATGDGVVKQADNNMSGYGNLIIINHGFGYETYYAHLSRYNTGAGKKVKRGDVIGYVGSTGRSQAPHLHYEVRVNNEPVNPMNFYYGSISSAEYTVISKIANQENQAFD